jgi:hypothetical protein
MILPQKDNRKASLGDKVILRKKYLSQITKPHENCAFTITDGKDKLRGGQLKFMYELTCKHDAFFTLGVAFDVV